MKFRLLTATLGMTTALAAHAGDWPQFRGPGGNGLPAEKAIPSEWGPEKNIAWKANVPGVAWSCPIVVGDKVIVATAIADGQPKPRSRDYGGGPGGRPPAGQPRRPGGAGGAPRPPGGGRGGPEKVYTWKIVALNRESGSELWSTVVAEGKPKYGTHGSNTFASETPASDGERIYGYFGAEGVIVALDMAGKEVWKKEIGAFPSMNNWGTSSSPIVHDGVVFVQCDNEQKSFLLALDAKTGEEKWKVSRNEKTCWSTPYIWKTKSRTDLVIGGSQKVQGYDPATGKSLWELTVGGGQANASPTGDDEHLYFGTGMGGGGGRGGATSAGTLFAIKAGATGDITPKAGATSSAGVAWSQPRSAPGAATPLVYDGYVYVLERQGGMVSCFNAKTGEPAYTKERIPNGKAFWASPWAHDGKIFCLDESGTTHVIKAGPEFDLLHANALGNDLYWSTPAVAGGSIFLRGVDTLFCVK